MKVLVIGSGARENAISDAILRPGNEVFAFMSAKNPGICRYCKDYAIGSVTDVSLVKKFALKVNPDLAIIGPEAPLGAGVVDELEKSGIPCFGPTRELARLETSKSFTRMLVEDHKIRGSPEFMIFEKGSNESDIRSFLNDLGEYVIKPDGLTGGKGVKVFGDHINSEKEAMDYCSEILSSHGKVIVEEKLDGEEFSLMSISDGRIIVDCPAVQDHKRAFDEDKGPNTGGMGSYSDSNHLLPFLKQDHVDQAHEITVRVAEALKEDIGPYKGVMYGGFMVTRKGIKLIEYNARFGDPEAMNVLPLIKNNFAEVCDAVANSELHNAMPVFENLASVCKYVVPSGYPDNPMPGKIVVPPSAPALTFYASVDEKMDALYTAKSRAVAFVGIAETIEQAEMIAEKGASSVKGPVFHRKDIGTRALLQKRIDHMKRVMQE